MAALTSASSACPQLNAVESLGAPRAAIDRAAASACSRGVRRVNLDELPTSLFRFVGEHRDELSPPLVGDLPVQGALLRDSPPWSISRPARRAEHVADPQVLDRDQVEALNELAGELVRPVATAIRFPLAVAREQRGRLAATVRASPAPRDLPRRTADYCPVTHRRARARELLAGRERHQPPHPKVDSDCSLRRRLPLNPGVAEARRRSRHASGARRCCGSPSPRRAHRPAGVRDATSPSRHRSLAAAAARGG